MEIKNIEDLAIGLDPSAFMSYINSALFVTKDGGELCLDCVIENRIQIEQAIKYKDSDKQWEVNACEINYEQCVTCEHCGKKIDAAYGQIDPDGDETTEDYFNSMNKD